MSESQLNQSHLNQNIKDQVLSFAEFCSITWGRLPSRTDLKSRFNNKITDVTLEDLEEYIDSSEFLANLLGIGFTENHLMKLYTERGTSPETIYKIGIRPLFMGTLSRNQLDVLASISDIADPRPIGRKLNELGISTQDFSMWLNDETFYRAFIERLRKTVESSRLLALNSLALKAANGDNTSIAQLGGMIEYAAMQTRALQPVTYAGMQLPEAPVAKTNAELTKRIQNNY